MTTFQAPTTIRRPRRRWGLSGTAVIGVATLALAAVGLFLAVSLIGIVAVGISLITIVGKVFTLSVPALIALSTILFASTLHTGTVIALSATVLLASAVGLAQGVIVGKFETDPIVTTIASAAVMVGIGQLWTNGRTVVASGDSEFLNSNIFGFLPVQGAMFVGLTAALFWWHRFTTTGRRLTLVGLNEKAALVAGIRSWPLVALAFTISGATTGLAGGLLSAQSGQGALLLGASFGFDAIVAVVVGGVGIKGGVGTPLGAAIGAVFVGLLENILALIGFAYEYQMVAKGVLVLAAVAAMGLAGQRKRSR
jgi:ribose transport system permease protein